MQNLCDMGAVLSQGELRLYDDLEDAIKEYQRITDNLGTFE